MRLFLLTALTMAAFAANSLLNRMALTVPGMDAASFGTVRLLAGAAMLWGLCAVLRGGLRAGGSGRLVGVLSLLLYVYAFSGAYTGLDAGMGALILFGVVQVTMFAGGLLAQEPVPPRRWLGAALALGGLAWLLWPGAGPHASGVHGLAMAAAGLGWGIYSLAGRASGDALQATAANFVLAAPVGVVMGLALSLAGEGVMLSPRGTGLAVLSGAVTSGLGYALWYAVLPRIGAGVGAVAQLTVPVIAMGAGLLLLGEALSPAALMAIALVLGGVAIAAVPRSLVSR